MRARPAAYFGPERTGPERKRRSNAVEAVESGGAESGAGSPEGLSHVEQGAGGARSRMVDVSPKAPGERAALARAVVRFPPGLLARVLAGEGPKGAFGAIAETARVAGLLAAKRTAELVPMCHPLGLDHVEVDLEPLDDERVEVRCRTSCTARTGVEMEAMVGASLAALTLYDMTKALDPAIRVEAVELVWKRGGKRGLWQRP